MEVPPFGHLINQTGRQMDNSVVMIESKSRIGKIALWMRRVPDSVLETVCKRYPVFRRLIFYFPTVYHSSCSS